MSLPTVLFVSKPIAPPYHDGTKCLVRDLACTLQEHRPIVMSSAGGPCFTEGSRTVSFAPVYGSSGTFSPSRLENARAALWLLLRSRADLWHFVFAPNWVTSTVGRIAKTLRRAPVVQTIASPPAKFEPGILFGDIVVAQSAWTRERVVRALGVEKPIPRLVVIPPPIRPMGVPSASALRKVRELLGIRPGQTTFVYPGDLEVSAGAETIARAITPLTEAIPDCVTVFACRAKTPRAPLIRRGLQARLDAKRVRFVESVDLVALLGAASVVLFPVDDLYGKVDLPISLLEAMQLGVPVLTWAHGPLAELEGAERIAPFDVPLLVKHAVRLVRDEGHRACVVAAQRRAIAERYAAVRVASAYEKLYTELLLGDFAGGSTSRRSASSSV